MAFSLSTIATWTWDPALVGWRRTAGGPAVTVANVIVQSVVLTPSRYVEDRTGAHEWLVSVTGSGPATVYRDGQGVAGSWSRPDPGDPTLYLDASGRTIPLRPGATWVELVPTTVAVSVTR